MKPVKEMTNSEKAEMLTVFAGVAMHAILSRESSNEWLLKGVAQVSCDVAALMVDEIERRCAKSQS